jgi:hypothetical protein
MEITPQSLSQLRFRKNVRREKGDVSLDSDMIRLLMAVDESKTLSQVAAELRMEFSVLKNALSRLVQLGLLERLERKNAVLEPAFFDALKVQVIKAVGPIGEFLIEDALADMGSARHQVPVHQAAELINLLADEIPDKNRRVLFQKVMLGMIPPG